jgi:hypothetical protein
MSIYGGRMRRAEGPMAEVDVIGRGPAEQIGEREG